MLRTTPFLWMVLLFVLGGGGMKLMAQDLPNAGYDTSRYHPLFIQSDDGKYSLNIGLYTQFRYNATYQSDMPDSVPDFSRGYNLARTRIFFEGNLTDKFYYHTRVNVNPIGNFELIAAYLQWNINKKMWLRMGRQFMALGREDWMYPQDLAAVEFSANDFTYAIWSSFGFQFRHVTGDKFRYYLSVGNGAYGGRQGFPAPKATDVTVIGRGEVNLIGEGWGNWDDMTSRPGRDFGLLLGFSAGHSQRQEEGLGVSEFKDATQLNVDLSAAGNGFHVYLWGTMTMRNYLADAYDNTVNGVYATAGYWFDDRWFGYARFDYVGKGDFQFASEDYVSPGAGISFYPFHWTNRTRFTLEYNLLTSTITNTIVAPDGQLGWTDSPYGGQQTVRLQIQFGF